MDTLVSGLFIINENIQNAIVFEKPNLYNNFTDFTSFDMFYSGYISLVSIVVCYWIYRFITLYNESQLYKASQLYKDNENSVQKCDKTLDKDLDLINANQLNTQINTQTNAQTKIQSSLRKNIGMLSGLYIESIRELQKIVKKDIIKMKIQNAHEYYGLFRVKLANNLQLRTTKYQLHGNNINGNPNLNKYFSTKDLFMICKFKYDAKTQSIYNMDRVLSQVMNYINTFIESKYKTSDFIIAAISSSNNVNHNEFMDGLININYELFNYKEINLNLSVPVEIMFTLPISNIYDLFLDICPNIIFESKQYVIDNENYESWDNKSLNDIKTF
jgi:hypothetical protein